jgi:transketolase
MSISLKIRGNMKKEELEIKAKELRLKVLEDIYRAKKGHIGGTYSALDLFVYLYYGDYGLGHYVNNKPSDYRDRLVVGKGHACLALYHIFEDIGKLPKHLLKEYGDNGCVLGGQLNIDTEGVEYSTGSLGHAIGIASGIAMACKMDNHEYHSVALIGDGECAEGSIWESIEFAGKQKLNNLICIVDFNRLGVTEVLDNDEELLKRRVESYGWNCVVIDGHNFDDIDWVLKHRGSQCKPWMIIAKTIKGKGVSFMENGLKWHHSVPSDEEYEIAKKELEE